jgi:hypothetical protein
MDFKSKNILKNSRYHIPKQHILYIPPQMQMWVGFQNIFLLILYVTKDIL